MLSMRSEGMARRAIALLLAVVTAAAMAALPARAATTDGRGLLDVVVQGTGALDAISDSGGRVTGELPIIGGLLASVPAARLAGLRAAPGVRGVSDAATPLKMHGRFETDDLDADLVVPRLRGDGDSDDARDQGAAARTKARKAWGRTTGEGVAVAVLDTGIAPSSSFGNRVVARADLTGEQSFTDAYGHGTFMAGLVAGDGGRSGPSGVAPDADLVDLKVAGRDGGTTLGQVLYALQLAAWSQDRFDIKVLNLSLGAPADDPATAPLTEAVERLWAGGITVVTAAGNDGEVTAPGIDPYVITVGALDQGEKTSSRRDDSIPDWSGRGLDYAGMAKPDLVAPGVATTSVRVPGSGIDVANPSARVGERWFRGSGTSMAAAVVSGAAALVAAEHPGWSPDQIKGALLGTADKVAGEQTRTLDVAGAVKLRRADEANDDLLDLGDPGEADAPADPGGDGSTLQWRSGDWAGVRWGARQWSARQWMNADWDARQWYARQWNARQWNARQWSARQWNARQWSARQWSARQWQAEEWAAIQWSWGAPDGWEPEWDGVPEWEARQWRARQWSARQWNARQWSARQWTARHWAARSWDGE
jgi:serine protease AprX